MNKYNRFLLHASFYHAELVCFKSVIQSGRSLCLSKIKKYIAKVNLPVVSEKKFFEIEHKISPLQLVNLHRNRRFFVIKLHTWFCLSYFLKTNKVLLHLSIFYEYQQFFSTPYLFLDTAATSTRKFT